MALVDLIMPGTDGLEMAAIVRADPALASIRLMLISSVAVEPDAVAHAGFVARMTKPVRMSQLYDALVGAVATLAAERTDGVVLPSAIPAGSRGTLLIVEDHAINQDVAKGIVAKLGFGANVAADGIEALDALDRRSYDAVLMDCHMPRMDGYQATAEIRRREAGQRRVPIFAMTASALVEDREKCIAAGIDDYLAKPVRPSELGEMLNRRLGSPDATSQTADAGAWRGVVDCQPVLDMDQSPVCARWPPAVATRCSCPALSSASSRARRPGCMSCRRPLAGVTPGQWPTRHMA